MAASLGVYFLLELYRPFEPRISPPENLQLEYTGPGAISSQETPATDSADQILSTLDESAAP